jgi:orotate phosphoribosyltransferase-like protein
LRKWKLYQRVKELHAEGMSLRKIGEELGLARNTVRKYAPCASRIPKADASGFSCQSA